MAAAGTSPRGIPRVLPLTGESLSVKIRRAGFRSGLHGLDVGPTLSGQRVACLYREGSNEAPFQKPKIVIPAEQDSTGLTSVPQKSCSPEASECDCIWRQGLLVSLAKKRSHRI